MHDVVMKDVTCYKDASEHDPVQWCPCPRWRAARFDQLDDSIQVWRPVVESACVSTPPRQGAILTPGGVGALSTTPSQLEHSSSPVCQPHSWWPSLPGRPVQSDSSINILSHNSHAHAHYQ